MDKTGEYHWDLIKEKANLKRKTPDLIERYYVDFLTQCRNMISSNQYKHGDKKNKGICSYLPRLGTNFPKAVKMMRKERAAWTYEGTTSPLVSASE